MLWHKINNHCFVDKWDESVIKIKFDWLCEVSKQKFKLLSLLNDLGILKIPKENNNKNNISQILGILFQPGKYILKMKIFKVVPWFEIT